MLYEIMKEKVNNYILIKGDNLKLIKSFESFIIPNYLYYKINTNIEVKIA